MFLFCLFWTVYLSKVVWHQSFNFKLVRTWYEYVFYAFNFCFLPFLSFLSINFSKYKNDILNALLYSGLIMGLVSFYLYRDLLTSGIGRISNVIYTDSDQGTISPLALSYAGSLTIALCIYKYLYEYISLNKTQIILLILNLILSIIMFYLGASRGSVVALLLSLLILFFYGNRKIRVKFLFVGLIFFPILIAGAIKMGSAVFTRTTNTIESESIGGREKFWLDSWNEFLNYPFLGGRIEIGFYPHNFLLEVLMATGFIGGILLLSVLIKGVINIHKKSAFEEGYVWVMLVLCQGVIQYSFSGAVYFAILLFFPLGLAFSSYYKPSVNNYNFKNQYD